MVRDYQQIVHTLRSGTNTQDDGGGDDDDDDDDDDELVVVVVVVVVVVAWVSSWQCHSCTLLNPPIIKR